MVFVKFANLPVGPDAIKTEAVISTKRAVALRKDLKLMG